MYREDGSIRSANLPVWDNRYQVKETGIFRGVVKEVIYTDHDNNDSGKGTPNEVLYTVMIIGGDRDGQVFQNARLIRGLGGFANFEEVILKQLEGITQADPTSLAALGDPSINNVPNFNGDVVYLQFLNGSLNMPVIVGMGYHQKAEPEASAADGQRYRRKFNGIFTEITKDGEFNWAKDNGLAVPVSINPDDPLYPFINQFAPILGQEEAVNVTLGNKYDFKLSYFTGLEVSIDGVTDSFDFLTGAGAEYSLDGLADSHELSTTVGTGYVLNGLSDSHELSTAAGASIEIKGLADEVNLSTTSGAKLLISATSGVDLKDAVGAELTLATGEAKLVSVGGAKLDLAPTGLIKFGNSTGDVLQILGELLQTLTIETPAGFSAPLSQAAKYAELMIKLKLISG